MDKEQAYDEQIAPLMKQIIAKPAVDIFVRCRRCRIYRAAYKVAMLPYLSDEQTYAIQELAAAVAEAPTEPRCKAVEPDMGWRGGREEGHAGLHSPHVDI